MGDDDKLKVLPAVKVDLPELTARQIIKKASEAAKRNGIGETVFSFLRQADVEDLDSKGNIRKGYTKTYRAYTDGRDQELVKVDGKPASHQQVAREQARNRERQRRYLARKKEGGTNKSGNLVIKNMDLFQEKFTPVLAGIESVNARPAYVIQLQPNKDHKLKSRTVNRFMNQLNAKLWVDKEEFHIARINAKLKKPVAFLGGLAGAVNAINISVFQKRLVSDTWVDESVSANFDARIFWKTYHFRMKSRSSHFEAATTLGDNNGTKPPK
ncbi:MAG: hypothetical protein ACJ06V_12910, partial [Verrucomicrobiota bacterium]